MNSGRPLQRAALVLLLVPLLLPAGCTPDEVPAPGPLQSHDGLHGDLLGDGSLRVRRGDSSAPLRAAPGRCDVSLRTASVARTSTVDPATFAPATTDRTDGRVTLETPAAAAWWQTSPAGLQQGWTLHEAPPGAGSVAIDVAVTGAAVLVDDGAAMLHTASCRLRYDGLRAWDAAGVELAASLESTSAGLRVLVDDRGAAYPIEVDPYLSDAEVWSAVSGQQASIFGSDVASAGDVNGDGFDDLVVGAHWHDSNGYFDNGRAYLFLGSATGPSASPDWIFDGTNNIARLGSWVTSAGDVNGDGYDDVLVDNWYVNIGVPGNGRALLFLGSPTGLASTPDWWVTPGTGSAYSPLRSAGDVNGDGYSDVAFGVPGWSNPETTEGKVDVFLGSASGLPSTPSWTVESDQAGAALGTSVAAAGDVDGDGYGDLVVGAPYWDGATTDEGAVFLYLGGPTGLAPSAVWSATSGQGGSMFGVVVDGAGDVDGDGYADIAVSAFSWSDGQINEGKVFVYAGQPGGPGSAPVWSVESNVASLRLGEDLSGVGDVDGDGFADLLVGTVQAQTYGAAMLYRGSASGLEATPAWEIVPGPNNVLLGVRLSGAGDVNGDGLADVLVADYQYSLPSLHVGGVFLFYGSVSPPPVEATWEQQGGLSVAYFGSAIDAGGDVDGDGYGDLLVGAEGWSDGQTREGAAFLFAGSADGPEAVASWSVQSDQDQAWFGSSAAGAGDVNGDGYDDVVVGAFYWDGAIVNEGGAWLYLGSPTGLEASPAWMVTGGQAQSQFGASVAGVGDVNGDGYDDVLVGAYGWSDPEVYEGALFLYFGSPTGPSTTADWSVQADGDGARLGWSVDSAGDINGDGYADFVAGAPYRDGAYSGNGAAYVFLGSATGPGPVADWMVEGTFAGALLGWAVAGVGDTNADGFAEVAVGVHNWAYPNPKGGFGVYAGSASGPGSTPMMFAEGDVNGRYLGAALSGAGDVNGDGYGDVLAGGEGTGYLAGEAYVYLGSATGPEPTPTWIGEEGPEYSNLRYGRVVAGLGDINGDGYGDIAAATPIFFGTLGNEGKVWTYLGNEGAGDHVPTVPHQLRAVRPGEAVPIPPGLRSTAPDGFDVVGVGRTPYGRTEVQLEVEVKPLGTPFDGTGLTTAPWTDTGVVGQEVTIPLTGLSPGVGYHWRARWQYDPADALPQPRTRWYYGGQSGFSLGTHVVVDDYDDDGDGVQAPLDCDDGDASVYPGAPEACDLVDSDCDGSIVDGDPDTDGDLIPDCVDLDDDGDGDLDTSDCEPLDATIYAGATELCDGIDSDCNGSLVDTFVDTDGDGDPDCIDLDDDNDGDPDATDCADLDATIYAGATELCDAIDSDCNGSLVDGFVDTDGDGDPDCIDLDDDNDGDPDTTDCADLDATIYTGAPELCDGIDSDCNGSLVDSFLDTDGDGDPDCVDPDDDNDGILDVDEGAGDVDGDGIPDTIDLDDTDGPDGDPDGDGLSNANEALTGTDPDLWDTDGDGDGDGTDCAPLDATVGNTLPEVCDVSAVDNDCDPTTDENVDGDGDGLTICDGDCDDGDDTVFPGAPELCDSLDNDCDPATDEDDSDDDADGSRVCDGDCDDAEDTVYPGAPELCDGLDNDCDGLFDADEQIDYLDWYADTDEDDYGDPGAPHPNNPDCLQPDGYIADDGDCDDGDADVNPDGVEICDDGIDQDCDGADLACGDDDDSGDDDDETGGDDDAGDDDDSGGGCSEFGCSASGGPAGGPSAVLLLLLFGRVLGSRRRA